MPRSVSSRSLWVRHALLPVVLLALACNKTPEPTKVSALPSADSLAQVFKAQFDRAAVAWTQGDLDTFMADYAPDSNTTFMAGREPARGFDWIRAHYAPLFEPGAKRDSLRFESLVARPLAPGVAMVTARFILFRNDTTTASGPFTLVMEERPEGWKILHDHTSPDPK